MSLVRYDISQGINALCLLPTDVAKRLIPANLQPVEVKHGCSLIGITMFDFNKCSVEVNPYVELVVSLYVVPRMGIMEAHPHAAVYPLMVASSSTEARNHAIDLWHLPHFHEDITLKYEISEDEKKIKGTICCHKGEPIAEISISSNGVWGPMHQTYQSFQNDEAGEFIGILDMEGTFTEHEEETGSVKLFNEHRFYKDLDLRELDTTPIREMWLKDGVESYNQLLKVTF